MFHVSERKKISADVLDFYHNLCQSGSNECMILIH